MAGQFGWCIIVRFMFLKSLELHGFKSFSEKTVLEFLPPKKKKFSITAIVGPNGSGKSNLADAIRWVMGEQSLKTLRGKKSEDIIFAGSEAKGKMSVCSVDLTIDNHDSQFPLEYEEVVLTRRVYRSGEGEYLLNGVQVRLLDVQLLLAKAQCGHNAYSIIGQGTIDRLLLQTPEERKVFFDEAAGIKEFQIKRHYASLKLVRSREHMAQAESLLQEIIPRLKILSRQVKKLEQRQSLEEELRALQEMYYLTLWKYNEEELQKVRQQLAAVMTHYTHGQEEWRQVQAELAELAREISGPELFSEIQSAFQKVLHEKSALEKELAIASGKLEVEYGRAGKAELGWLANKSDQAKKQLQLIYSELIEANEKYRAVEKQLSLSSTSIAQNQKQRLELQSQIQQLRQLALEARTEETIWQLTGLVAVQAVWGQRERLGSIYGTVAQLGQVDPKYQLALDVAAGSHLSSLVVADDHIAEACIAFLRQEQLGVATFLPLNKVKPRFLPADILQLATAPGVNGLAIELVRFTPLFESIFSFVLGNTLIVEDIVVARRIGIGRVRMVTLSGDVLEVSGSMKGGYRREQAKTLSFAHGFALVSSAPPAAVEEELRAKEKILLTLEKQLRQDEVAREKLIAEFERQRSQKEILETKKHGLEKDQSGFKQEMALQTMKPEEQSSAFVSLKKQKVVLEKELLRVEEKRRQIETRLEQFHAKEEQKKHRFFALQEMLQIKQQALNKLNEEKNNWQIIIARFETKQEDLEQEVWQEMHCSIKSIVERISEKLTVESLSDSQEKIQKAKYQLSLIGGIDEEVAQEHSQTRERHDKLQQELTDLTRAATDLEELILELDRVMKKKREQAFQAIRHEFQKYFKIVFNGGKADIMEVYRDEEELDEVVEASTEQLSELAELPEKKRPEKVVKILHGIDVVASPPGKKIQNIQALSGGERTLTALALVCAILRTNPPPFVVFDEVEAALDEINTLRFTAILQELAAQSQFIIITHNRATMHAADALYGVTMGGEGVSRLVSVKIGEEN